MILNEAQICIPKQTGARLAAKASETGVWRWGRPAPRGTGAARRVGCGGGEHEASRAGCASWRWAVLSPRTRASARVRGRGHLLCASSPAEDAICTPRATVTTIREPPRRRRRHNTGRLCKLAGRRRRFGKAGLHSGDCRLTKFRQLQPFAVCDRTICRPGQRAGRGARPSCPCGDVPGRPAAFLRAHAMHQLGTAPHRSPLVAAGSRSAPGHAAL